MIYGELFAKFWGQKIILDAYGDASKDFGDTTNGKEIYTYKGFIAFDTKYVTIGVEAFEQIQRRVSGMDIMPVGAAVFIKGLIKEDFLYYFARCDFYRKDTNTSNTYKKDSDMQNEYDENFAMAGIDIMPLKDFHIMPNVLYSHYVNGATTASATGREDDVIGRVTVYYKF